MADELTRARLFGYGVGSIGTGIFGAVPGLLLLFFLTDTLGVAAGWAGLVLLLPKAWDVLLNPRAPSPPARGRPGRVRSGSTRPWWRGSAGP